MKSFYRIIGFLSILVLSQMLTACIGETGETANVPKQVSNSAQCLYPLLVSIAVDQSGSMKWSGTPQVTVEDLIPLIEQLNNCSGEIGLTFVRGKSDLGIERLLFPELPAQPLKPVKKEDEETYEFDDRLAEFNRKQLEREKMVEKQREAMKLKIEVFLSRIRPLLERPPKGGTDFNTAVNRADVFLAESDSVWQIKPTKFLIIVSDAIDTQKQAKNPFKSDAKVLWVNATTNEKILADLKFIRFESFASAVRYITDQKIKRSQNDAESK